MSREKTERNLLIFKMHQFDGYSFGQLARIFELDRTVIADIYYRVKARINSHFPRLDLEPASGGSASACEKPDIVSGH